MNNKELLNEALDLLKEIKSQQGNADNGMSQSLNKAIRNLENIEIVDGHKTAIEVLSVLGKLFDSFPEIQKIIEYLSNL